MQHLLHKNQFDAVLGTRSPLVRVARSEHFFVHRLSLTKAHAPLFRAAPAAAPAPTPALTPVFIGALIPKRFAKRAVTRNLIRRQIYAVASELALTSAAYVVRLSAPWSTAQFKSASSSALKQAVRAELQQLLSRHICPPA